MPDINLTTAKATAKQATASLKSAGSLVVKKAERTKLVTVTLPRAYAELGKAAYKDASRRDQFADLFKATDDLLAQRKQIQQETKARATATSLAEKAKNAASDAAALARMKAIDLQAYQAFAKLGEAIYLKHGNDSGPVELVNPIAEAVARRDQLDQETTGVEMASKGRWITPKRILWGVALVWGIGFIGSMIDPDHGRGGGGNVPLGPNETLMGRNFSDSEMEKLLKKASRLKLGMDADSVLAIMGKPTKRWDYDPTKGPQIPGLKVVDPRVVVDYRWCSEKDPGNELISVALKDGEAYWITAHNGRGNTVIDLKR